ncbi:hypothetical protein FAY30_02275 [Bacillus sp. S3]|uniref:helix-turn-helix domain-containing protein n=1 Tax=Bacillus sp. S3 TaxID=486398 RepID=UPI00118D0183|nr:helix-turn-helix domain-containing protein [Bacillus sp. S3]QCJ40826.1 hypothetical protein FAY30_02275 [Bacillus sp. S3]
MVKYSEGFKLMLVKEYLAGKLGYRLLAQKYGMKDFTRIMRWVKVYEKLGEKGLMRKKNKESYSVQFKLDVLSFIKRTGSSEADTALQFGLTNPSMISSWKKAFLEVNQLRFVKLIIDYVVKNGTLEKKVLQEDPFRSLGSVTDLFRDNLDNVRGIIRVIDTINRNVEEYEGA